MLYQLMKKEGGWLVLASQVRYHPELVNFCQVGWTTDLHKWGLIVSLWINPSEWDFNENIPKTDTAIAYLYKHKDGSVYVAKSYEEQVKIHKKYGIPIVDPGEQFHEGDQQLALF
ncbi:hypothetical protein Dred_0989 [Desulforamulus reducens MI-1]|uniref:Uncharacterized protein n=2 Tax=Desulforamulus TaxID=2916693 RepID=A4J371_DESRM|nr:hypothetical protein Dred_0989 [Desulforamulus reducens MI-1]